MSTEIERPYSGAFVGNTHHFALRVYIEDTDLGGVVYHANYLRFLERARSDMLRTLGIDQREALEAGKGIYAVAEIQIKFVKPARLQDDLVVLSQIAEMRGASCIIAQRIRHQDRLMLEAKVTAAFLSPTGRPQRQPLEWVEKFKRVTDPGR